MSSKEKHIDIAKRHKRFIAFTCLAVKTDPDTCQPETFCVWVVVASYYRTIHLIEAVFDKLCQNHVIRDSDGDADRRRNYLLGKLQLSQLREEYKGLRRFTLHAKYFPSDSVFDYDVITQLDIIRQIPQPNPQPSTSKSNRPQHLVPATTLHRSKDMFNPATHLRLHSVHRLLRFR